MIYPLMLQEKSRIIEIALLFRDWSTRFYWIFFIFDRNYST
jgi:hypothetical protein